MSDSCKTCVISEPFLMISLLVGSGLFILAFYMPHRLFCPEPYMLWRTTVTTVDSSCLEGALLSWMRPSVWDLHWGTWVCVWDFVATVTLHAHNFQILLETPCFWGERGLAFFRFWASWCAQQGHLYKLWAFLVPPGVVTVTTHYSNLWQDRRDLM